MDTRMLLFFMTAFAGFVMVVGGMWLLYKQKIYIDKESNQPVEISLPGNFRFKSNYPALALFVLGFFPLVYPFHELSQLEEYPRVVRVNLRGVPNTNIYPAVVYASLAPPYAVIKNGDSFSLPVPFIGKGNEQYKVLLTANDHVLDSQTVTKSGDGDITIRFSPTILAPSEYKTVDTPVPPGYK